MSSIILIFIVLFCFP